MSQRRVPTRNNGTPQNSCSLSSPVRLEAKPDASNKYSQHNGEIASPHSPGEARRDGEANVVILTHPSTCYRKKTCENTSKDLLTSSALAKSTNPWIYSPQRQLLGEDSSQTRAKCSPLTRRRCRSLRRSNSL